MQAIGGARCHTGRAAQCERCGFRMTHPRGAGPWEALGWSLGLLGLFSLLIHGVFMTFSFAGGTHGIGVAGGVWAAVRLGSVSVGAAVLLCTVVCPVLWGLGMVYVAGGLATRAPGPGTAGVLRMLDRLRPWVMPEVFLLGVVVAHGKLAHDGAVGYGGGFYLYLAAAAVWFVIGLRVRDDRLWERLRPARALMSAGRAGIGHEAPLAGCQTCGLVQRTGAAESPHCEATCARCHASIENESDTEVRRCVVLLVLGMLLLWPANTVPIVQIAELGPPEPATVWEGIKVLYFGGSPALAALVFLASMCVPVLKVVGLSVLVVCRSPRRARTARRLAQIHRLIATAGRWSMVDMFVITLLIGLVRLGGLASVDPRPGALAFLAVVLLSIVAAEMLNAKLFWNHTETRRNA